MQWPCKVLFMDGPRCALFAVVIKLLIAVLTQLLSRALIILSAAAAERVRLLSTGIIINLQYLVNLGPKEMCCSERQAGRRSNWIVCCMLLFLLHTGCAALMDSTYFMVQESVHFHPLFSPPLYTPPGFQVHFHLHFPPATHPANKTISISLTCFVSFAFSALKFSFVLLSYSKFHYFLRFQSLFPHCCFFTDRTICSHA